jgi:hypothetical protein
MALENAINQILAKRTSNRSSVYCAYQVMYEGLSKEDKKTLDNAWIKNFPVNLIVQALRADGKKCSADTIRTHKDGTCRCPKE